MNLTTYHFRRDNLPKITYDEEKVLNTYKEESKKAGHPLTTKEVTENPNLPCVQYIYQHIGKLSEIRERFGLKKEKKTHAPIHRRRYYIKKDLKSNYGLPQFCKDCLYKTKCPYNHNVDKCEYAKEYFKEVS